MTDQANQTPPLPAGYQIQDAASSATPPLPAGYSLQSTADNPYPIAEGDKGAVVQTAKTAESIFKLPKHIWDAFTTPATDEEKAAIENDNKNAKAHGLPPTPGTDPLSLAIHRLITAPMQKSSEVADAYQKIADDKKRQRGTPQDDSVVGKLKHVFIGDDDPEIRHLVDMAQAHRLASIVPLLGSAASDIVEHFNQGDASGAVASLLSNIAAGKAVDSVTKGLGKQVSKVAPKTATVAGESTPVMAGQMKDAAPIAKTMAAEPSQAIAEQQQVAGQQGVKNVASEALNRQLEKVGKDAEPVQKQLPASSAPGGKEPFVFTIPGNMPEEVISGKAVVPAKRVYAGTEDVPVEQPAAGDEPNYNRQRQELGTTAETIPDATRGARSGAQVRAQEMGSTGSTVPERVLNGPSTAKQIKWQYLTSGTEEGESTAARGQGTLHTSNPKAATETLEALKNLEDQTPAVKDAISSLEQQLQQYHSYDGKMPPSSAAVPRAGQASSFADAAQQVKAAAQPTFKKLDQLSDGAFSTFQNKLKMATKAERRATNMEDMEAAQQAQTEARKGIDDLMTKHSSQFQPNELANAQSAWRDMQTLDTVHSYVEKAFSAPEDVAGASKTISRNLNGASLKTNLNQMLDQVPRADLERVLGKDGVQNLYEVAELTAKPENLAKMQSQITQLASEGTLTKLVKSPLEARNLVARTLATSPRVSQMMMNALKFGTPAKIYGPLIANAIAQAHVPEPAEDDSKK